MFRRKALDLARSGSTMELSATPVVFLIDGRANHGRLPG
jgi:hypothetical protein